MPTFRHGKNTVVLFDKYDLSQYFNSVTTSAMAEAVETTTFGSANKTYAVGMKDGTVSFEGLWSGVLDTEGADAVLNTAFGSTTKTPITVASEGATLGRRCKLINADDTSYEIKAAVAEMVTISGSAQASGTVGGLDGGVLLAASQALTATVANTGVDNAAASSNGGVGHLHVTTNTRNGAITVKVQHSANNSTWADLFTFTATTSATTTSERIEVAAGTAVNRYLRANVSGFAGSTGTATITVGFARR
jgi:hypothetical protein